MKMRGRAWYVWIAGGLAVIGSLSSVLDVADRLANLNTSGVGAFAATLVELIRLAAGPVALALVLFTLWRPPRSEGSQVVRDEWKALGQYDHWLRVRDLAVETWQAYKSVVEKPDPTVSDQSAARNAIDAFQQQVFGYAETWVPDSYWTEGVRREWEGRSRFSGPQWARPMWETLDYSDWWIRRHDPHAADRLMWAGSGTL